MSPAGRARIAAYLAICLIVGGSVLATSEPRRAREAGWQQQLERADSALAGGDAREARRHWEGAYRNAVHARAPEGLLKVGRAYLRIGETLHDRESAVPEARRIFLLALFQARERGDADAVARSGEAFAALGDRDVADRAFDVALTLAGGSHDTAARERVTTLIGRVTTSR